MLKVTKNMRNYLKAKLKKKKSFNSSLESVQYLYVANCRMRNYLKAKLKKKEF